jgi:hypothetical protein
MEKRIAAAEAEASESGWQLSFVFMEPFLRRSFVKLSVKFVFKHFETLGSLE